MNIPAPEQQALTDYLGVVTGRVLAVHAEEALLDGNGDVALNLAQGLVYGSGVVREKPVGKFRVKDLRQQVKRLNSGHRLEKK